MDEVIHDMNEPNDTMNNHATSNEGVDPQAPIHLSAQQSAFHRHQNVCGCCDENHNVTSNHAIAMLGNGNEPIAVGADQREEGEGNETPVAIQQQRPEEKCFSSCNNMPTDSTNHVGMRGSSRIASTTSTSRKTRRKCMASAACYALAFLGLSAASVVASAHPNSNVALQHQQRPYSAKQKMMHGESGKPAMRSNGIEQVEGNVEQDDSNRKLGSWSSGSSTGSSSKDMSKPSSSSSSSESTTWSSSSSSKSGKSTKTSKSKTGKSSSAKYRSEDVDIPIDTPAPTTPYPTLPPPTVSPSSGSPTLSPTSSPPTMHPTTMSPTDSPSAAPSDSPTGMPSVPPTVMGSSEPSSAVSEEPSVPPSGHPTDSPSNEPTGVPSYMPTTTGSIQSMMPSVVPSTSPTIGKSALPTVSPSSSLNPTRADRTRPPTLSPTSSVKPTISDDTYEPTYSPSKSPVKGDESGTISPKPSSGGATNVPTYSPTSVPTASPAAGGTLAPTIQNVTNAPTIACNDTIGWIDAERFGCSWYEENDEPGCPKYGNAYGGDMGVANDNCCYCAKETGPTSSPVEVTPSPTIACNDTIGWIDAGRFGCSWYEENDEPGCPKYGNAYGGDMGVANDNCCYCGKETGPTSSPVEVGPTVSPKPTWIVTNAPTVNRGSSPPTPIPVVNGTSSPTASPTVTASEFPSTSPSIKILPPTASPTENTPIPTFSPTTSSPTDIITIDNRINLQMELYGMPSNLNPAERLWYQLRTARYMEDFYNTNPHAGGLFQDSIKEEVYDVDVKVIVTDQVVVDGGDDSGGRNDIDDVLGLGRDDVDLGKLSLSLELDPVFAYPTGYHSQPELEGSSSQVNPIEGSRVYHVGVDEDEDDESYLPEFAVEDYNRRQLLEQRKRQIMTGPQEKEGSPSRRRSLQTLTYVTDPCTGENPLLLTFSLELSYRTEDPDIRGSDDVIAFPFEPPSFRTVYINNYLKSNNGVLQEDFQDLYCVTPIYFNGTAPAPSPPSGTLSPTISLKPTSANATASPSDLPSESPSLTPSTSSSPTNVNKPSGSPTISAVPSSLPSMAPSTSPSSMPSSNPSSIPSSQGNVTSSSIPSSSPSSIPSTVNGTLVPTSSHAPSSASLNGTLSPTVSSMPSTSNSPSVLNGTTATPTISSAPTTDVIVPEPLPGLGMRLVGKTEDLVEGSSLNYYQDETARYIRIFYNNYTVADDTIRGQVIDVTAEVVITNQEVTDGTIEIDRGGELSSYFPTLSPTPVLERISLTRWNGDDEGDEEFLPEFGTNDNEAEDTSAVSNKKKRTKHTAHLSLTKLVPPRRLTESMDVDIMRELQLNGTCDGPGLNLVFTVTIEYRLTGGASNSSYTDDDIINEPFSTSDYRDVYLNDFLQGSESAGNFDSVTCTSPINFPDGNGTGNATLAPTISPRPSGSTTSPVPTSIGVNGTSTPTSSPRPSSIGVNGTATPTSSPRPSSIGVNGTATPTSSPRPSSIGVNGTSTPTSPVPTSIGVNGTSTPTSSPRPSSIGVNGTSTPTSSPRPSSIGVNGTATPTSSPRPSTMAPPGEGNSTNSTSAPTISSVPSVTPGDDIFNDMRAIDPTAYERKCHNKLDALPYNEKTRGEEFEVSFEYGIESSSDDLGYIVEDMESLILDFMATSVLRCDSPTHQQQQQGVSSVVKLRRKNGDGEEDATTADLETAVVRIRYPEFGEITSISKCDTTPSQAKGCAILRTKLLITSIGAPTPQAHRDILNVLSGAFREDVFEEFIPDVMAASYLGPDPEAIILPSAATGAEDTIEGPEKNSTLVAILFTISCVVILFMIIVCHVFPRVRMQAMEKVALFFGRRRHKPLPTSSGPPSSEDGLAGALVTYTDYPDEALNEGKLTVY